MSNATDAELVQRSLEKDENAFKELVTRYQGHVYGLAYSIVGDWAEAQDVAQETFIRAYLNLDQLRDHSRFAAWLRRVAFGVTMNWLRAFRPGLFQQLNGKTDLDHLEIPDFNPGPPELAEKRELADAVMKAVASLPAKYRVPLTMFHLDGLSYQKVADFLDIPLGTAKSLVHRAQEKLKSLLPAELTAEMATVQEVFNEHKLPAEFANRLIKGLESLRIGGPKGENSVMAALAGALLAAGEDVTYEFLFGVSGAAFRLQICQPEWCPSAPNAGVGYDCVPAALEAAGYETSTFAPKDTDPDSIEKARAAILDSINKGIPSVYSSEEASLIVGYENGGKELLLRRYGTGEDGYSPMKKWPWGVWVLRKRATAPNRRKMIVRSLATAVKLANTASFANYASGFAAYGLWTAQLRDASRYVKLDTKGIWLPMMANAHCFYSLLDARQTAAIYLRSVANEFGAPAAEHLGSAAELYAGIYPKLTRRCPLELAPQPWRLKPGESWTQELRNEQADALQLAESAERQAVDEIGEALAIIEGKS